jgi:hypothetical protein
MMLVVVVLGTAVAEAFRLPIALNPKAKKAADLPQWLIFFIMINSSSDQTFVLETSRSKNIQVVAPVFSRWVALVTKDSY